jgi:release factor glutamine methyltransferase
MQKEIGWLLKEKYHGKTTKKFYRDVKRLEAGEPLDYVIGFTEFLGCKIDLSKKPLIPRPETEFWAERAVSAVRADKRPGLRCLDMFSGSGCLGVAVLSKTSVLLCDIADSQTKCLNQAEINCQINKISKERYKIIKSDVFSKIKGSYDFIFANPPYIPTKNKNKIQKSVLKYEPKEALFGGGDGLFYIRKFLKQAKNHLNPGGKIFMEFSPEQKKEIEKILKKYKYLKYEFRKDQYGKWRYIMIE